MPTRPLALLVALALLAVPVAACGRDDEGDVRRTLQRYADAVAKKDYQALCDDLLSKELVRSIREKTQYPCEVLLSRSGLADAERPRIEIRRVTIDGDRASAVARTSAANEPPSDDTVQLVRQDGSWRIAALASPGTAERGPGA
jgi:hypothetical protein